MGKFYGSFVAFAIFIQIQSQAYMEYGGGKKSSIPMTVHRLHKRGVDEIYVKMNTGMGLSDSVDVQLKGVYYWQRLFVVDNRNKSTPYRSTVSINKIIKSNYTALLETIVNEAVKAGLRTDREGVLEFSNFEFSIAGSMELEVARLYKNFITFKNYTNISEIITREYNVRPNSIVEMYQLRYFGTGLFYASTSVSTKGDRPLYSAFYYCRVRYIPMVKDIQVVLTNHQYERPNESITETFSRSSDINNGFTGKYAWLVPIWTTNKNDAVTKVTIVDYSNADLVNMRPGKITKYRYLEMVRDPSDNRRLKRVGLLRSPMSKSILDDIDEYGWDDCTSDINAFRLGDLLHLCWNYVYV